MIMLTCAAGSGTYRLPDTVAVRAACFAGGIPLDPPTPDGTIQAQALQSWLVRTPDARTVTVVTARLGARVCLVIGEGENVRGVALSWRTTTEILARRGTAGLDAVLAVAPVPLST